MGRRCGGRVKVSSGSGGSVATSSSIALLQERFRRLQKMRERKEMKPLKVFSESETTSDQTNYYEKKARSLMVHPELVIYHKPAMTARSSFQDFLSLGLDLYGEKTEPQPSKTQTFADFWSIDSVTVSTLRVQDKPDVDTSLHL